MTRLHLCAPLLGAGLLAACSSPPPDGFQGYFEGEYVYLAAPQAGYLKTLDLPRGSRATPGQAVFAIASDPDDQALAQAEAQVGAAREKLHNLQTPRRSSEIATLEANLRAAEAAQRIADTRLARQEALRRKAFVAQAAVDDARSARDEAAAQVAAVKAQLATYRATLGRDAEVRGAEADVSAASAAAAQKRWIVDRKAVAAPAAGEIADTYYRPGEWVPAGAPVASLLPDARRRLRFFVPETAVANFKPGDMVEARCDGCPAPIRATVDFVAAQAEYTPPVIYSQGSREKLVFRVEAVPSATDAARLRPGLPADVQRVN